MNNQRKAWNKLYGKDLLWKKETISLSKEVNKKSVLELGVGNGKTLKTIIKNKPKKIAAIDFSENAIDLVKKAIKYENLELIWEDFLKYEFKEKFDVVVCYYFLNNFEDKQRRKAIEKIKSILNSQGIILFEDFSIGDYRQNKYIKLIERNTIEKQNGIICHFFEKDEILDLFKDFNVLELKEKTFFPIRADKKVKRKIINALIKRSRKDLNLRPLP